MLHYDTERGLSDLDKTVQETIQALSKHRSEFDSIAVQGTSGLLIGAPVALLMSKPLVVVREDAELQCHHSKDVENARNAGRRVLFLDDQISTGATLRDVEGKLHEATGAHVTATYLYQYDTYDEYHGELDSVPDQRKAIEDALARLIEGNPWR